MGSARGASQLYVRRLDQLRATPLAGTDGARAPFFSPDGRWIAFVADGVVKKIAATGGGAITLGRGGVGGAWGQNGIIVVSTGVAGPLVGMSSDGGTATTLTTLAEGEITHRWPQLLPEGNAVLYTASNSAGTVANANVVVQALPKGPRRILQKGATYGRFLPSGHIVYDSGDTNAAAGAAQFAVANTGTLVYLPGRQLDANAAPVVWMNRAGETMPLRAVSADWSNLTFSPDGRRVAMDILDRGTVEVWVYDWTRDQLSPLTSDPADDLAPTWTPDGRRIVFSSNRAGRVPNLYWQSADGSGDAQRLATSPFEQWATSWHPSGKFLAVREVRPETGSDVLILPMEGDETRGWRPGTPTVFVNTRFEERMPEFSPDGRWLAYTSNESGRYEVYVRPFPGPGSRWLVSVGGSSRTFAASWSRTRQELLYESPDGHVMVVPFTTENGAFRADRPRLWPGPPHLMRARWGSFELHPDGERVAMAPVPAPPASAQNKVVLVLNFFDELRRVAPSPR
jgi:serine/threonine-protein kinase